MLQGGHSSREWSLLSPSPIWSWTQTWGRHFFSVVTTTADWNTTPHLFNPNSKAFRRKPKNDFPTLPEQISPKFQDLSTSSEVYLVAEILTHQNNVLYIYLNKHFNWSSITSQMWLQHVMCRPMREAAEQKRSNYFNEFSNQ